MCLYFLIPCPGSKFKLRMEGELQRVIERSRKTDERFCFVVVGETRTGKSTLLNSLANN